jgi:23S rRNA (uracil1939-C5)-methyltransferase
MVAFITKTAIRKELFPLAEKLRKKFPKIRSVCMNCNPNKTNVILGAHTEVLSGESIISDTMCGVQVDLSPESFYQVNTLQAERLYQVARSFAQLTGKERLLDLYCGAGTIGLSMADAVEQLIGVEIVPEAVENAKKNAERAGVLNAEFYCGDAGTVSIKLSQQGITPDIICVDPPRKGCDEATIQAIVQMHPKRIVMISCNPATAARDCSLLHNQGYSVKKVQPVDLFPRTGHVECVVSMTKTQ